MDWRNGRWEKGQYGVCERDRFVGVYVWLLVVIATNELSLMQRLEKEVRIGYGRGKRGNVSVVREHYLRDDIPCKSEACVLCGKQIAPGYLEGAWSHLIYRP